MCILNLEMQEFGAVADNGVLAFVIYGEWAGKI